MIRYWHSFLLGFNYIFRFYSSGFSIVQYGYRYHVTSCIISCTPSQSTVWFLGVLCSGLECHYVFLLLIPWQSAISSWWLTIVGILISILSILNYTFQLSETRQFWFCDYAPYWMFLTLCILFVYWIEYVMPCLVSLLGYSTGEFQALQIIVNGLLPVQSQAITWNWFIANWIRSFEKIYPSFFF